MLPRPGSRNDHAPVVVHGVLARERHQVRHHTDDIRKAFQWVVRHIQIGERRGVDDDVGDVLNFVVLQLQSVKVREIVCQDHALQILAFADLWRQSDNLVAPHVQVLKTTTAPNLARDVHDPVVVKPQFLQRSETTDTRREAHVALASFGVKLKEFVETLGEQRPSIILNGHTDWNRSDLYNDQLGLNRSEFDHFVRWQLLDEVVREPNMGHLMQTSKETGQGFDFVVRKR